MEEVDCEEIVKRFAILDDNIKNPEDEGFGANDEQQFEFKLAFKMIAKGTIAISYSSVNDIFLSLGLTMPEEELCWIVDRCFPDDDGKFSCDQLVDAYDQWRRKQMDEMNLRAIFAKLADCDLEKSSLIPVTFPFDKFADKEKSQLTNDALKKKMVKKKALKQVLGRVLYNDPNHPDVTQDDVLGLVDEISCSRKGTADRNEPFISWPEFARLFRK